MFDSAAQKRGACTGSRCCEQANEPTTLEKKLSFSNTNYQVTRRITTGASMSIPELPPKETLKLSHPLSLSLKTGNDSTAKC
eukprot:1000239-Amphidinium_carterae.2